MTIQTNCDLYLEIVGDPDLDQQAINEYDPELDFENGFVLRNEANISMRSWSDDSSAISTSSLNSSVTSMSHTEVFETSEPSTAYTGTPMVPYESGSRTSRRASSLRTGRNILRVPTNIEGIELLMDSLVLSRERSLTLQNQDWDDGSSSSSSTASSYSGARLVQDSTTRLRVGQRFGHQLMLLNFLDLPSHDRIVSADSSLGSDSASVTSHDSLKVTRLRRAVGNSRVSNMNDIGHDGSISMDISIPISHASFFSSQLFHDSFT